MKIVCVVGSFFFLTLSDSHGIWIGRRMNARVQRLAMSNGFLYNASFNWWDSNSYRFHSAWFLPKIAAPHTQQPNDCFSLRCECTMLDIEAYRYTYEYRVFESWKARALFQNDCVPIIRNNNTNNTKRHSITRTILVFYSWSHVHIHVSLNFFVFCAFFHWLLLLLVRWIRNFMAHFQFHCSTPL